jgi:hypothetical protein
MIPEYCKKNRIRFNEELGSNDTLYMLFIGNFELRIQAETDYVYQLWVVENNEDIKEFESINWNDLTELDLDEIIDEINQFNKHITYIDNMIQDLIKYINKTEISKYLINYTMDQFED